MWLRKKKKKKKKKRRRKERNYTKKRGIRWPFGGLGSVVQGRLCFFP